MKAPPIYVSRHADGEEIRLKQVEMQKVLERLQQESEGHWGEASSWFRVLLSENWEVYWET